MRVLILGSLGYIGSNIAYFLKQIDSNIDLAGIDFVSADSVSEKIVKLYNRNYCYQIFDYNSLSSLITNLDTYDFIINCTNQLQDSEESLDQFILSRVNCISEICKKHNINLINLSSYKIYDLSLEKVDEKSDVRYKTKEQFSYWIKDEFFRLVNINNITLRLSTVYGGIFFKNDQSLPYKAYMKERAQLNGELQVPFIIENGEVLRNYINIKDVATIIYKLLINFSKSYSNKIFNIATDINTKNQEVLSLFENLKYEITNNNIESFPIIINDEIKDILGDYQFIKLEEGIKDYYKYDSNDNYSRLKNSQNKVNDRKVKFLP